MIVPGLFILLLLFGVYSYGFVDLNLSLSNSPLYVMLQKPLSSLVFTHMPFAAAVYVMIIGLLYVIYIRVMCSTDHELARIIPIRLRTLFLTISVILVFSFPALTYDIFNYMLTAKVLYTHRENPYIVMPVEIPNEPALSYTRAANKVALYGPTWLIITGIPHALGFGNVWLTIIAFKATIAAFYLMMLYLIFKMTGSKRQVLFFGLNPLVLTEVLVSSHNDVVMMVLVLLSLMLLDKKNALTRARAGVIWILSVFVKGATIVLLPLAFLTHIHKTTLYTIGYWLMFGIFLLTPFREELYPWYAVWFLTFAALIPLSPKSRIHGFTIALTIGLSMRHVPYIYTREYGGYGPMLRILFTVLPVFMYMSYTGLYQDFKRKRS